MGKAGSYRQEVLTRQSLLKMQEHEERRDRLGKARSVEDVPPLVWSDGEISEAESGKTPFDLDDAPAWKSSLIADYERHVEGARRDKRAAASGKLAVHAFIQFPTDLELTPENERLMLAEAVKFTNEIHGGDAVFHARLDRDEQGKHGVDVFFAPRFEKLTGRKKNKRETWISLTKFEKEKAESLGLRDAGPRARGRMFQDLWAAHLREKMGLEWAERGQEKESFLPDRLSPEAFKLKQDRERLEQEKAALVKEREVLKEHEARAEEMRKAAVRRAGLAFQQQKQAKSEALKLAAVNEGLEWWADGRITGVKSTPKPAISFSPKAIESGDAEGFMHRHRHFLSGLYSVLERFQKIAADLGLSLANRVKIAPSIVRRSRGRDDGGLGF